MLKINPQNYFLEEFLPQIISAIWLQDSTTDSCFGTNVGLGKSGWRKEGISQTNLSMEASTLWTNAHLYSPGGLRAHQELTSGTDFQTRLWRTIH